MINDSRYREGNNKTAKGRARRPFAVKLAVVILLLPLTLLQAYGQDGRHPAGKTQADWNRFEKMMRNGEYSSAFELAETVYKGGAEGGERLAAAFRMADAAAYYQEDYADSAVARYRALLPQLDGLDKALCHALLGEYDSAMLYEEVLKRTPVEKIGFYCSHDGDEKGFNATPTAFDVVALRWQDHGSLSLVQCVELQRRVCAFHGGDADDLRIWHDSRLLDLMGRVANSPLNDDTVLHYIAKYRGTRSGMVAGLYNRMALRCHAREDYVGALAWCDSAIALFPKSEGGVNCANLRMEITKPEFDVKYSWLDVVPGQPSLQRVSYRNVDRLWFRIIPYDSEYRYGDNADKRLRSTKPLEQWDVALQTNGEYRTEESYFTLPALKPGRYLLLVSPTGDFKERGFVVHEIVCTEMLLVTYGNEGLLLDRRSGRPIANQTVNLRRMVHYSTNYDSTLLASAATDREGRFHFDHNGGYEVNLIIDRGGYRMVERWSPRRLNTEREWKQQAEVRLDRPIYKPGDTLHAAVVYFVSDGRDAMSAASFKLRCVLLDPNGKELLADSARTDYYGVASFQFVLPKDRLPGTYVLQVYNYDKRMASSPLRVEEYRQPKFMVTMPADGVSSSVPPSFGVPYTVHGMAASYSAVPVSGARVKYTVRRIRMPRWWWGYDFGRSIYGAEVDTGEVATAADGTFAITFTPTPDSSVDLGSKPNFQYTVSVDVTDINGETHSATTSVRVGYRNAFLSMEGREEVRTLEGLAYEYFDLNGNALPKDRVKMTVERLCQPAVPLLDPSIMSRGAHHTMSEADFNKAFPHFAYSEDYNNRDKWSVDQLATGYRPLTANGVYRITLTAPDADTVVRYRVVTASNARKVQSQELLWRDIDKTTAEVGDTVTLRFGTRHKDVEVYYVLQADGKERKFRRLRLSDELHTERIVVDSTMLGGFYIDIFAVRDGMIKRFDYKVEVPFTHKKLDIEIATFRDKLLPGENEEWTIRVRGVQGERLKVKGETAALILTMYDDALNSYGGKASWDFMPFKGLYKHSFSFSSNSIGTGWWLKYDKYLSYDGYEPNIWRLKDNMLYGGRLGWYYKNMRMRVVDNADVISVGSPENGQRCTADEIQRMPGNSVESIVAAVGGIGFSDVAMAKGETMEEEEEQEEAEMALMVSDEPQVRSNLNTLAFFVAGLQTDSNGTATYRFTVPELLTRWNVRGLAITRDIKIGTLDRTLVTSKPLMVQPNMPRFLRQGDSTVLMAKVLLNDEPRMKNEELPVEVTFAITDAATGLPLTIQYQKVMVKDAAEVTCAFRVPKDVYVVTYEVVAKVLPTAHYPLHTLYSDGERGQLPVVSNRQAVTVSKALYINGPGEKTFNFQFSIFNSPTAEPRLLAAELTANPIWMAVKCMPYLKSMENPSTIYLANQLYVNSMGSRLVQMLPTTHYPLPTLKEDVKQTLLQASPWVRDAESEEEQMAAMRNYFDTAALNAQYSSLKTQLTERQNADGGWSWMPEGESSVWVTQQVLKRLAITNELSTSNFQLSIQKALQYIDNEHQRDYEKYIKPYLSKKKLGTATDIDYLYTRSLYSNNQAIRQSSNQTEAYKYYYSNALKNYRKFEGLYTQAQLALIFYRHGDRKQALDLLHRIGQKALVDDEMGMYWRDNRSGWWWYQRPIETQALIIYAYAEITPDDTNAIGLMQQWLLKQKQTTHWGNDEATTKAIAALMLPTPHYPLPTKNHPLPTLTVFGTSVTAEAEGAEGYQAQRWTGSALDTLLAGSDDRIVLKKSDRGIAWGAVCYQYVDDVDKIEASDMGITLHRSYIHDGELKVGDRMKVRIEISCDRAMDYLELIDGRPSCVEPLSTRAGWRWSDGLSYYITVNNTDTRCYIEHIDKGKYVFEYEVYVTNSGTFLSGPATMQCMYAPEFRSVVPAEHISVK